MGFCFSRPAVDDDATEQSALLGNQYYSGRPERAVQNDPFAHFSAEELAQREEEERLRALERQTTEALINISQRGDFAHAQTFASTSGSTRDYTEILREFNQKIKLPMVTLTGPAEFPRGRSTNTDVVAVLAEGRILDADVRRLDDGIDFIIDAISDTHIRSEGDLIVPLSASSEASTN